MKLSTQLLMELGAHGLICIDAAWREGRRVARIYEDPTLAACSWEPTLSVLSLDIETDRRAQAVYAVSLAFWNPAAGEESSEVLFNASGGGKPDDPSVRSFPNEAGMLAGLRERIIAMDPDVITGAGMWWTSTFGCSREGSPRWASASTSAGQMTRRHSWTAKTETGSSDGSEARR